ncbi:MAG: heme o synthase [Chitinophagaceae bacterium]
MMKLIVQKLKDYQQLGKLNLSLLVVFSSVIGYIIIPELEITFWPLLWLTIGGFLVTISANAMNEVIEIETDKKMKRTKYRPLPDSRMRSIEAILFSIIALLMGLFIFFTKFNTLTAIVSLFSWLLYTVVYTPLKRISPIAVLIGAIPGSLPCLIGWIAGTNHMGSLAAWTLFIIQFFWQFPHFWAIAWIGHEDYTNAGMKMLPREGKVDKFTAFQCVLYSFVLIPLSALPMVVGLGSWISFVGLFFGAGWLLYKSMLFYKNTSDHNARQVMFASFVYLPLILITLLIDKYV